VSFRSPSSAESELSALVRRVAAGEEDALEQLFRALEEHVFGFALRFSRDGAVAEEVTVDVFARLWSRAASYDPERGRVIAWVLTMTRSVCLERLRSGRRAAGAEVPLEAARALTDRLPGPASRAQSGETAGRLQGALLRLPREQEELLRAAFFGGLSYSQVAEATGQPLGTVKTRIRAGLAALRRALGPENDPEGRFA
jgi:RNA polymerase sigma-70 factor (ECF subfamily)